MSIVNQIATFGRDAGSGISSGFREARRRKESDRNYNSIQQRYDLQDKRYNNEISRMDQERQRQAQETERQYAADGVQAIYSAPPEFRAQAYQGWLQGAQQRGYDVAGAPPEYSDEVLYKLAGSVGANLKPDSSKAPANIQEWDAFQKMTPEEKAQFLNMKRANQILNLGGSQVVLNPDGDVSKNYPVTPKPQDMPEFKADVETATLEAEGKLKPKIERDIAQAKASGTATGEAIAGLPGAEAEANSMTGLLDKVLAHPGLDVATGKGSILNPVAIPGTDRKDFLVLLDQLQGKAFLQAFESLKGGGQITEVEGKKATEAMGRMNTAQSKQEFIQAIKDIKAVVATGLERSRQRANAGLMEIGQGNARNRNPGGGASSNNETGSQAATPQSQAEFNALPSGAIFVDPDDGQTYRKP